MMMQSCFCKCHVWSLKTRTLTEKYSDCFVLVPFALFICLSMSISITCGPCKETSMLIGMLKQSPLVIIQRNMILIMKLIKGGNKFILMNRIQWVKSLNLKFIYKRFLNNESMQWEIKDMTQRTKEIIKKKLLKLLLLMIILKLLGGLKREVTIWEKNNGKKLSTLKLT